MNRIVFAALALACACSPALAAAPPADLYRGLVTSLFVMSLGAVTLTALLCFVQRQPLLGLVAAVTVAAVVAGFGMHPALADTAATVAQPATDTAVVTVPLGTWIASYASAIVEVVTSVVMLLVAYALRSLPAGIATVLKGLITQQLVERAISFGMNTVAGAAKDKVLSFDVSNAVLANALNYLVTHFPGWLVSWMGGADAIRDHIIALMPVAADASLATSTPTAAGPTTTAPVVAG